MTDHCTNEAAATATTGDAAPLFAGDGLGTRLEFSISLSMLNRPPAHDIDNKNLKTPPPRIQSQVKRKSLRHLIHAHIHRPDTTSPRAPELAIRQTSCESPLPVDTFNLPLPKLPSPLASFGVELQWSDSNNRAADKAHGMASSDRAELPTVGNVIESDEDSPRAAAHPDMEYPTPLADQAGGSLASLGVPIARRWSSSGVMDNPQRRRSLMFQPLLDVTAVGALIDTFADRPMTPLPATTTPTPLLAPKVDLDGPKQRIMGGLRRATTVISSNRHKLKLLRRRPSADVLNEISAIESTQPDGANQACVADVAQPCNTNDDVTIPKSHVSAAELTTTLPPVPQQQQQQQQQQEQQQQQQQEVMPRIRRAGTLNISTRRPPPSTTTTTTTTARLKRSPTHHGQPPCTASAPADSTNIGLGYAPIAVSLKSSRSRQFLLNTPLGEFEILRTLGQGSYGKVKLMRSALTAEQFAVKIIKRYPPHKHRRGHAEYRKAKTLDRRVVREANLAAILGQLHPHIVPLHDFRVTDTHFYLFYAYVNGVTLAERVGSSGLSEREARAVFKPVVETIRFCHQYSVIHRDIKLENVLIDYADEGQDAWPLLGRGASATMAAGAASQRSLANLHRSASAATSGKRGDEASGTAAGVCSPPPVDYRVASVFEGRVKIIDFGLANFFDGTSLMETFCGSLPYTAPEILRGDAYVGPEIDVWSLGVLLYVMMTGQFPFEDPAQIRNFDKIMAGDFALRPTMSRALQDLLVKMLEPSSKRRITMQGVLQHEWLSNGQGPGGSSLSFAASCEPMPSAATGVVPAPGTCCARHPYALTDAIHDRRTLLLPGPTINRVIAREVATCLDRSLDEVMRLLEVAMSAGRKSTSKSKTHSYSSSGVHQGAAAHQWPSALSELNSQSTLMEIPNSPVVSVYALVLQQISMRRYYLELPATEPSGLSTTLSSSSQLAASTYGYSGGLRDLAEPPPTTTKSQTLIDRLTTQISHLVSMTGSLVGSSVVVNASVATLPHSKQQSRITDIADSVVQPAYMQPLSTGQQQTSRKRLRSSRNRDPVSNAHQTLHSNEPRVRCIGTLEELHDRITLPSELSSLPAEEVLGLVSSLLKLHEITHTFVETQRMPMQKALDTSVFPLKTIAAMVSSAYVPLPSPPPPSTDPQTVISHSQSSNLRALIQGMFSKPTQVPATVDRSDRVNDTSRRRLTQLRTKASSRQIRDRQQHSTLTIVHPHLSEAAAATMDHCRSPPSPSPPPPPPPASSHSIPQTQQQAILGTGDMPEITTTVPVKYATAVIFAQYSPSLNRWRETEVVEYYSCSVRIELVRVNGPGNMRHPRYALLVDRMTGHKGKFSLFKMFLLRMVAALPALVPEKFEPRPAADPLITVC
ncbi:Serine/threonine-protein kinase [Coemansia aciculifera]|nr:Serine/threonine-protein kinase [Coemansia aciculifera]